MGELICPLCNAPSPENALYCQQCGNQLRCQDCGANLLPIARVCIQCGKNILGRSTNDQFQVGTSTVQPGYNRLKFHETPDVRDLDLTVSNEAVVQLGDLIPSLVGIRLRGHNGRSADNQLPKQSDVVEMASEEIPSIQAQLPAASSLPTVSKKTSSARSNKPSKNSSNNRTKKPSKKGGEQHSSVDTDVAAWVSHPASKELAEAIDHGAIITLPLVDRALLALYGIYRTGYEQEVPLASMIKYLYSAFDIQVQSNSLSKALYDVREKKTAKAPFLNFVDEQGYKITPSGRKYIEDLLKPRQSKLVTTEENTELNGATQP